MKIPAEPSGNLKHPWGSTAAKNTFPRIQSTGLSETARESLMHFESKQTAAFDTSNFNCLDPNPSTSLSAVVQYLEGIIYFDMRLRS